MAKQKKNTLKIAAKTVSILTVLSVSVFCFFLILYCKKNEVVAVLNLTVLLLLTMLYVVLSIFGKQKFFHKLFAFAIWTYFFVFLCLAIMKKYELLSLFKSAQKLKELILKSGSAGVFIFMLIQIAQVIISPVPGLATVVAGAQIYGAFLGFVYSSIGIIIGSIVAFLVGRLFGKNVTSLLVGEDNAKKYRSKLNKKGKVLLPLFFVFPFFPDDIICLVAGMTNMSFWYFFVATIIARPISILFSSYFASGKIIPFRGWWWAVWAIIGLLITALFVVVYKNEEKIEKWVAKKFKRTKKQKV